MTGLEAFNKWQTETGLAGTIECWEAALRWAVELRRPTEDMPHSFVVGPNNNYYHVYKQTIIVEYKDQ